MSWADFVLTGFDLETDSPDPNDARIITACIGVATPDGWNARTWLLQPERNIPDGATAIHGITTEMARIDGRPRAEAIGQIADMLAKAWAMDTPVVGHNVSYDLTVLDRECRRVGIVMPELGAVVDTLVLGKAVDRYRKGSRKLADVARHYGFGEIDAHNADADARAACRIAWRIARHHPEVGRLGIHEIGQWHADQYREQRSSFIEYRRRKGEPLDDESTDWPIRPYVESEVAA